MIQWERKLLDLSLRNTLINLKWTQSVIPILSESLSDLEDALSGGEEFGISPRPSEWAASEEQRRSIENLTDLGVFKELIKSEFQNKRLRSFLSEGELSRAILNVYRSSKTSLEENGANTLYLALGFLRWYETTASQKPRYAPLILLPIEIIRKSALKGCVIRLRDEDPQINITLLQMLVQDFGIQIQGLDPLPQDAQGIDLRTVFTVMRKAVMDQPRWDVIPAAFLGIFSFSQFVMWNDLRNRSGALQKNKVVRSLMRVAFAGVREVFPFINEYVKAFEQMLAAKDRLYRLLEIAEDEQLESSWASAQLDMCENIRTHSEDLKEWMIWGDSAKEAARLGMAPLVRAYEKGLTHEEAAPAYYKGLYIALIHKAIEESPVLNSFSGAVFQEKIRQFQQLDEELTGLAKKEVFYRLASQVPNFTQEASQKSEVGVLQRAIRSGGRGVSIRRLFEQVSNLLPRLCPCMLFFSVPFIFYLRSLLMRFDLTRTRQGICPAAQFLRSKNLLVLHFNASIRHCFPKLGRQHKRFAG